MDVFASVFDTSHAPPLMSHDATPCTAIGLWPSVQVLPCPPLGELVRYFMLLPRRDGAWCWWCIREQRQRSVSADGWTRSRIMIVFSRFCCDVMPNISQLRQTLPSALRGRLHGMRLLSNPNPQHLGIVFVFCGRLSAPTSGYRSNIICC